MCVCARVLSHSVVSNSSRYYGLWPARLLCPWGSPDKNTGASCHALLQGIFLTQGLKLCLLCLLHWQADSWPLSHLGYTISLKIFSLLKIFIVGIHSKNSKTLATWCGELTHLKRPWCWERLRVREGDDRGWDGWMASLTQWTWVWVDSGSWWWTGRPGMLLFMGSQRVGHNWATESYNTWSFVPGFFHLA